MKLNPTGSYSAAKAASVILAVLLWFNVATEETYNYKVNLPILYIEPTSNTILVNSPPDEIQAYLSGSGKSLFIFYLRRLIEPKENYVSIALGGYAKGSHRIQLEPEDVYISMGDNITVESILNNAAFTIEIDSKTTRMIPVEVDSLPRYQLDDGLVLNGSPIAVPDFVITDGPTDMLNAISSIKLSSMKPSRITLADSVVTGTLFNPSPLVTFSEDTVSLKFPVERLRTKLFTSIPVTLAGFPQQISSAINPDTLSVLIQGPESVISLARPEDIEVILDYRSYREQTANGDSLVTPMIRYPSGITSASITPVALHATQTSL